MKGWLAKADMRWAFLLLVLGALGALASIASCASSSPSSRGPGANATATMTVLESGDAWIPLRSQAPADILAAARSGQLFQDSQANGGEGAPDLSRLGAPVFVQALRPSGVGTDQLPDFYVVPAMNTAGATTDAIELALNSAHTAVQEVAIITYATPRAGGMISALTQDEATQLVANQRHVAVSEMGQPVLVYFALDTQWQANGNGQAVWAGGGALPADPIWLLPAATAGGPFLAGSDGVVYTLSQLPQATLQ